jgi:hypothetical protein
LNGEKCVGRAQWPIDNNNDGTIDGILKVSKDDGSGNGFNTGNDIYFKIWNNITGEILLQL